MSDCNTQGPSSPIIHDGAVIGGAAKTSAGIMLARHACHDPDDRLLPHEWHDLGDLVAEAIPYHLARMILAREGAKAIRREKIPGALAMVRWELAGPSQGGVCR
jgi:hypothetical protein